MNGLLLEETEIPFERDLLGVDISVDDGRSQAGEDRFVRGRHQHVGTSVGDRLQLFDEHVFGLVIHLHQHGRLHI